MGAMICIGELNLFRIVLRASFTLFSLSTGLHQTYCKRNIALNAYSVFTTISPNLIIRYKVNSVNSKDKGQSGSTIKENWNMRFIVKIAAFTSRGKITYIANRAVNSYN